MRFPLAYLIATLVVVAAGSVVITFYAKNSAYVINATSLAAGQNMTVKLYNYAPSTITLYGVKGGSYEVRIYCDPEALMYPSTGTYAPVSVISNTSYVSYWVPLYNTNVATITVPRIVPSKAPFTLTIQVIRIS
jgi:hypothetical protein